MKASIDLYIMQNCHFIIISYQFPSHYVTSLNDICDWICLDTKIPICVITMTKYSIK